MTRLRAGSVFSTGVITYRFNRRGEVVKDSRRYIEYGQTYNEGDPLRYPRRSSAARRKFKAARAQRRAGHRG